MKLSIIENIVIAIIALVLIITSIYCVLYKGLEVKIFILAILFFGNGLAFAITNLYRKNNSYFDSFSLNKEVRTANLIYATNILIFGITLLLAPNLLNIDLSYKTTICKIIGILFIIAGIISFYIIIKNLNLNKLAKNYAISLKTNHVVSVNKFIKKINTIISVIFIIGTIVILLHFLILKLSR